MGIPDHMTCLLRNLFSSQEATVKSEHGTTDWFQIGKGVRWGCILPPCLFNLYAEYTMRNAGLEEAQAGIKIARRNINNLRYADDTTLMAESEGELKGLFFLICEFYLFIFVLLWFCHTSTWIHHGCTRAPNPEPPSHLPPHTISLGHPSAPAPSILYPASNLAKRLLKFHFLYTCLPPQLLNLILNILKF